MLAGALLALALLGQAAAAAPGLPRIEAPAGERFAVAVFGDMPYRDEDVAGVDRLIAHINADPTVRVVIHVGDLKGGGESCSDELLQSRHRQLQAVQPPLVYTPGDNEWTDCHRFSNGLHLPTERLAFLRRLFFPVPGRTGGQHPAYVLAQSATGGGGAFVENVMFTGAGVVFATLHVVGSNNDLESWGLGDTAAHPRPERIEEFHAREDAALAWLDRAFDEAKRLDARGVLLAMQANPRFEQAPGDPARAGFDRLLARLKVRAADFGRPVLLVHGDGHRLMFDRPFAGAGEPPPRAANVLRLQTYGDRVLRWVRVTIDPGSPALFRVAPRRVPGNTP